MLLLLREVAEGGEEAHRRAHRLHLRRVHRPVQRHHRRGDRRRGEARPEGPHSAPVGDQGHPRRVRGRAGAGQEDARRRGPQSLQADREPARGRRRRAAEVEHPHARPHRLGEDAAGPDAGPHPERPLHHRRRHHADRGRLRRRGRREHHRQPPAGRRPRHRAGPEGHRLHRRDRQDRPQEREPQHHPGRLGRGGAAGAAQAHRGHGGQRPAQGRTQAPSAGVPAGRHHQHPLHLRRRLLRPGRRHRAAPGRAQPGVRPRREEARGPEHRRAARARRFGLRGGCSRTRRSRLAS